MKFFKIVMFILLFIPAIIPIVYGLGVAPGSVKLIEDESSFQFKVFNNENLDLKIFFEIQGDKFIELEQYEYVFSSNELDKIFSAKIKNNNYSISQQAYIIIKEQRLGSSQINVNLGLYLPVSLLVFEQEAFIESSLNVPLRNSLGVGPYVISLKNIGLNDAFGEAKIVVDDKEVTQSFFIEGKGSKQLLLNFSDSFPKGEYDVDLFINYDNKLINSSSKMYSGSPFFNISKLSMLGYQNNILSFNVLIDSDWPERIDNLSVFAKASDLEFESRTFSLSPFAETTIPVFVKVVEDDFMLYLRINNQEHQEYNIMIKEGVVFIDGVAHLQNNSNPLNLILIILVLLLIIFFVLFESSHIKTKVLKKNMK